MIENTLVENSRLLNLLSTYIVSQNVQVVQIDSDQTPEVQMDSDHTPGFIEYFPTVASNPMTTLTSPPLQVLPTTPMPTTSLNPPRYSTPNTIKPALILTDGLKKDIWDIIKGYELQLELHNLILNALSDPKITRSSLALKLANNIYSKEEMIDTWYDKPTEHQPQKLLDGHRINFLHEICFKIFPCDSVDYGKNWAACMAKITGRCRTLRSRAKKRTDDTSQQQ